MTLFTGNDFGLKGGRGKIRAWAVTQAAVLRALGSYVVSLQARTDVAKHPKIQVLKRIVQLQRRTPAAPPLALPEAPPAPLVLEDPPMSSGRAAPLEMEVSASTPVNVALGAEAVEDVDTLVDRSPSLGMGENMLAITSTAKAEPAVSEGVEATETSSLLSLVGAETQTPVFAGAGASSNLGEEAHEAAVSDGVEATDTFSLALGAETQTQVSAGGEATETCSLLSFALGAETQTQVSVGVEATETCSLVSLALGAETQTAVSGGVEATETCSLLSLGLGADEKTASNPVNVALGADLQTPLEARPVG